MLQFRHRTAVITGGAKGIGLALARRFAAEEMNVAIGDIDSEAVGSAAETLRQMGASVLSEVLDVSAASDMHAFSEKVIEEFGNVHVLCNNAGVVSAGTIIHGNADSDWDWVIGVNMWGVLNGIRAFTPHLLRAEEGHVVNTASLAAFLPRKGIAPYVVSKQAIIGISDLLALELEGSDVGVSVLCPGAVRTGIAGEARVTPAGHGDAFAHSSDECDTAGDRVMREVALRAASGVSPALVADLTIEAIRVRARYVFTDESHARAAASSRSFEGIDGGVLFP